MGAPQPPIIREVFKERHAYWRRLAACRTLPLDVFFPPPGQKTADEARAVCRQCPVATSCLSYALETRQDEGVWAGYTHKELRRLRRGLRVAS